MTDIVVDLADMRFSQSPREVLRAPSLGACIGLALYDPRAKVGGLAVCVLPCADPTRQTEAGDSPILYTDLAIPRLLEQAVDKGIEVETAKLVLAGGGQLPGLTGAFDLGRGNRVKALEVLDHYGLKPALESLGGGLNRSLSLEMRTGTIRVTCGGKEVAAL